MRDVKIFTDGSCVHNPGGPGGWSAILFIDGRQTQLRGDCHEPTTSNRMEITAALEGLRFLGEERAEVTVYTDSIYLKRGASEWLSSWRRRRDWLSPRCKVKNADLWRLINALSKRHNVRWVWIKGHSESEHNNQADKLSRYQPMR